VIDPLLKLMIGSVPCYGATLQQSTGERIFALFGTRRFEYRRTCEVTRESCTYVYHSQTHVGIDAGEIVVHPRGGRWFASRIPSGWMITRHAQRVLKNSVRRREQI